MSLRGSAKQSQSVAMSHTLRVNASFHYVLRPVGHAPLTDTLRRPFHSLRTNAQFISLIQRALHVSLTPSPVSLENYLI
ncbi:MAG: hypothetical protein AAF757_19815 [Cyanobacteria bacterium P01_D01_bin.116]